MSVVAHAVERRHRGGRGVGPVDLHVGAGEVMVLMGPNGAGKTTLLRLLAGVDRPQRGELRWHQGERRSVGLALDSAVEETALSGMQSAYFWCRQWVDDETRARALCAAALQRFGLWEVRDEPAGTYSYGMRRRLALVEALAHEPRLAALDEPTAGLDPAGVQALLDELRARRAAGRASVVASNDANFAAAAADRVAFLVHGVLVRCASPAALLAAVGAARVAELTLSSPVAGARTVAALRAVAGVQRVDAGSGVTIVGFHDAAALPRIVAAADAPGGRLRRLRLHEPDLADAFRELTGEHLAESPR